MTIRHIFVIICEAASNQVATDHFPEQKTIVNDIEKRLIKPFNTLALHIHLGEVDLIASR